MESNFAGLKFSYQLHALFLVRLGIRNLVARNDSLLGKWLWRFPLERIILACCNKNTSVFTKKMVGMPSRFIHD